LLSLPAIPRIDGNYPVKNSPNKKAGHRPAIVIDSLFVATCIVRQPDESKQEQAIA